MSFWNAVGAGISGAFGVGQSFMNQSSADKDRALAAQQYDHQKEFAQNSIQWRVNDAKKAGIHPLYALGSQGISYAPSSFSSMPDTSLSDAGNAVGSAVAGMAGQRQAKELHELQKASLIEDIRSKQLSNEMSAKELMKMGQSGASHSTLLESSMKGQATPVTQSGATKTTSKALVGTGIGDILPGYELIERGNGHLAVYPKSGTTSAESYSDGWFSKVSHRMNVSADVAYVTKALNSRSKVKYLPYWNWADLAWNWKPVGSKSFMRKNARELGWLEGEPVRGYKSNKGGK